MQARIEAENAHSIELHRRFGFEITGHEREVGRKFARWLSIVVMQLTIEDSLVDSGGDGQR